MVGIGKKFCFGFGRKIQIMKVNESSAGVRGPLLLHSVDNSLQY